MRPCEDVLSARMGEWDGGICIREGQAILIAPSGVQKERMRPEQIFTLSDSTDPSLGGPTTWHCGRRSAVPFF